MEVEVSNILKLSSRTKRTVSRSLVWIIIGLMLTIFLAPTFWILLTSFKTDVDSTTVPPKWIFQPTLENYYSIFFSKGGSIVTFLVNSMIVTSASTVGAIAFSFPAAYSLSRYRITGGKNLSFWLLTLRMSPPIVLIIPLYMMFDTLHLLDTHLGLTILYMVFNIPLTVWMLKSFIDELPRDFEEAAILDGCSSFQTLVHIVFPLCSSGLVATAILNFILSYNEFLFSFMFMTSNITLPAGAARSIGKFHYAWGSLSANVIFMMIPVVIFVYFIQKHLARGLTMGAIKR